MSSISSSLSFAQQQLEHLQSGNLIAHQLLSHVLHQPASYVWAHPEVTLSVDQVDQFHQLVHRATLGEPLAYLLQRADFYDQTFYVDCRVLIPRPETEQLVNTALNFLQSANQRDAMHPIIIDVGTGSGCIALTLAKHLPEACIYATDASVEALAVASINARLLSATNITFLSGNLLEPLAGHIPLNSATIIVANLPYISDAEYGQLDHGIRHFEPAIALRAGIHPETLNTQLLAQAPHWLRPGGLVVYETTNGRIIANKQTGLD